MAVHSLTRISLAIALTSVAASAQTKLYTLLGDDGSDELGDAVALAGDVDGDGVMDIIAGGGRDETGGTAAGFARVYSVSR